MAKTPATAGIIANAINQHNTQHGSKWDFGTAYKGNATAFETFIADELFPKLTETKVVSQMSPNRFNHLAVEEPLIGQYSEEYVILDSIPMNLNLNKPAEVMFRRNYPKIANRVYNSGVHRKVVFTLDNTVTRQKFSTFGDLILYAHAVLNKKVSDINVSEESEIKAMLIDYALNHAKEKRTVTTQEELAREIIKVILNFQNNSTKYNEAVDVTGSKLTYNTRTTLDDIEILVSDDMKTYLLDSYLGNKFHVDGIDITPKITSFDDLGGIYKLNKDVTVTPQIKERLELFGDNEVSVGDILIEGEIFTFDITDVIPTSDFDEVKPVDNDLFAFVYDKRALRYKRDTSDMYKKFENPSLLQTQHFLHYYSFKAISPFYNKAVITA